MKSTFQESIKNRTYWILMICVIAFGVGVRLFGLAASPMTEVETANANAALAAIRSDFSSRTSEPLYAFLTSVVFKFFSDQPATARLLPFLFGIALLFLPFAFRKRFSTGVILIWTLLLAVDPALIAWSKRADSAMIVICLLAYLIVALINQSVPAVIVLSAALIASPLRSVPIVIAVAAAVLILEFFSSVFFDGNFRPRERIREIYTGKVILAACGLALVFATAFFANPSGFGGIGSGVIKSFSDPSILIPPFPWLAVGLTYYGFQWILAIGCRMEGNRSRSALKILLPAAIVMIGILTIFFNQGVLTFVWLALVLTLCGAVTVDSILNRSDRPFGFIEKIYFFVPAAYLLIIYMTSSAFIRFANQGASLTAPVTIGGLTLPISQAQQFFFLAFFILTAVYFLIPMVLSHFSEIDLRKAGAYGILIAALIVAVGNAWDAAGFHNQSENPAAAAVNVQPLLGSQTYVDGTVLRAELSALSVKTKRSETEAAGMIVTQNDTALRWALRDYPNAVFTPFPIRESASQLDFYLTVDQPAELISAYSGMEIAAARSLNYRNLSDLNWINWLLYRKLPAEDQRLILWQKNSSIYPK